MILIVAIALSTIFYIWFTLSRDEPKKPFYIIDDAYLKANGWMIKGQPPTHHWYDYRHGVSYYPEQRLATYIGKDMRVEWVKVYTKQDLEGCITHYYSIHNTPMPDIKNMQ